MIRRLGWLLLAVPAAWTLGPLVWAVACSLKRPVDFFGLGVVPFLQFDPTLANWQIELSERGGTVLGALLNSLTVAVLSSAVALVLAAPAAYGIARLTPPGRRRTWWIWLISQRFLPPVVLMVPFFLMMKTLHLLDSRLALILVHAAINAPLAALILQDAFADLPGELEEAAFVDGASLFQAFRLVVLPLGLPAFMAAGILCAAFSWNEFLLALTLTYADAVTMPVITAGSEHSQGVQFAQVAIRSLLAVLPPALLALFAQRFLIRGLTLGALKG